MLHLWLVGVGKCLGGMSWDWFADAVREQPCLD
jgi:hypothetical protein